MSEPVDSLDQTTYRRRIRAWTMYDWANSAFATTILAAVLPAYYSEVAGATLPSAPVATAYWTSTLSISLIIVAVLSPILGTIADVIRGKKKLLSIFVGIGVVGTGLLFLISTGDWFLASVFFVIGRIGFAGGNIFYDSLLPHVAKEEDQDSVSARGFAIGYLGGGLLLAANVAMIFAFGGEFGSRLSFLSVAIWWAAFSVPLFRHVPEPPSAGAISAGASVLASSFSRLKETLTNIRQYRELFRYLIAFLIYNDGIGTIIGVAVIYGAELGFGSTELILAILLVQFIGIPFSLIFGRIPNRNEPRRAFFLAFVIFNIVALPIVGLLAARILPSDVAGSPPESFATVGEFLGEDTYGQDTTAVELTGNWDFVSESEVEEATSGITEIANNLVLPLFFAGLALGIAAWFLSRRGNRSWPMWGSSGAAVVALLLAALSQLVVLTAAEPKAYAVSDGPASFELSFNGQAVEIDHSTRANQGDWEVLIDDQPLLEDEEPVEIDAFNETTRYGVRSEIVAGSPGPHKLTVRSDGPISVGEITVLPPLRESNLGLILAALLVVEIMGLGLAFVLGRRFLGGLAEKLDTKNVIILALIAYSVIAVWGFFLSAVVEFWFLAWMVAVVQGGSQALSRSLYASMSPASLSGEFFGFFSVMSKFSAILGPVVFAGAVAIFGSSRPAILSIVIFFLVGIALLVRVDVDEGRRIAREADRRLLADEAE